MQQTGERDLFTLVNEARAGDKDAFAQLCVRQCPRILYTCMGLMQNRQDAEDAAQEVLVRMHKGIRKLRATEAYSAWLNRITLSVCNNMRRENLKHKTDLPIEEAEHQAFDDDFQFLTPEYVEDRESRRELLAIIAGLTYNQRACLYLYYYENLSYKEIAQVQDTTVRAVEGNIARAKRAVRAKLGLPEDTPAARKINFGAALSAAFAADAARSITPEQVQRCIQGAQVLAAPVGMAGLLRVIASHKVLAGVAVTAVCSAAVGASIILPGTLSARTAAVSPSPQSAAASVWNRDAAASAPADSSFAGARSAEEDAAAPAPIPESSPSPAPSTAPSPAPAPNLEIVFEGGEGAKGHVNPAAIVAREADAQYDTCTWTIEDAAGTAVASGEGKRITAEVAALHSAGKDGVYTVNFTASDDNSKVLGTAEFRIYSGEVEPGMFGG